MNNKWFVGSNAISFQKYDETEPITGIVLWVDSENCFEVGNANGYVMEVDCPYGTQEMANNLLAQMSGKRYKGFNAEKAIISPLAEMGDSVTVNGVYSMLAYKNTAFGVHHTSQISAPGENEVEHEYPCDGFVTREFNRQLAKVRSSITKTAENIELKIEGVNGDVSTLSQTVIDLTARVGNAEGSVSTLSQKVDTITLSVSNGKTSSTISLMVDGVEVASKTIKFTGNVVFESDLTNGNTSINGACIDTGTILADYIDLYGWLKVYQELDENGDVSGIGGYIGYKTGWEASNASGVSLQTTGIGVSANKSCSTGYLVCTSGGTRIGYGSNTALGCSSVNIFASQAISEGSDRRIKNSFLYDIPETYEAMYRALKPCRYKRNDSRSDRYHTGFVAQEIEEAVKAGGLESTDLAAYCIDDTEDKMYSVRYTELIALNTAFVQKLMNRVDELEERLKKLEGGI